MNCTPHLFDFRLFSINRNLLEEIKRPTHKMNDTDKIRISPKNLVFTLAKLCISEYNIQESR